MNSPDHVWINGKRHEILTLDDFDKAVWPDCLIDLPLDRAGWATTQVGEARFACWLDWAEVAS